MQNKYENEKSFLAEKSKILSRADNSKAGQIDEEIKELVKLINSKKDYCTTSSCAGRITLIEKKSERKIDSCWLLAKHCPVTLKEVISRLKSEHDVWLLQESFILHVFCRDLGSADTFLRACHTVGLKRAGIISISNKIMIECMGNEKIETIIIKKGKLAADETCIKILVDECNSKMKRNRAKMDKLNDALKMI
jgi:tRNA wybutosine-synthesizing protein 3